MRRVIVESPFSGDTDRNLRYMRAALRDCLVRGEAPLASHGLYTQPGVLDDSQPAERLLGMSAGFAWTAMAEAVVVYCDLGISGGMARGIFEAGRLDVPVEYRRIEGWS